MQPPNRQILAERIRRAQADGLVTAEIADRLIAENEADHKFRKGLIWFCFYEPRMKDEGAIARFFRHWGGEALYNSHERIPETSKRYG